MCPQIWLALVSACAGARGRAEVGALEEGWLAKLLRFLVLFAQIFLHMKRSIVDYIAEHARSSPDRVAIYFRDRTLTYRELEEAAARCRGALAAHGIKAGDRVALVMSDSPEMIVAFLGIMGLGAIAVPCSTLLPAEGLAYVFKDSEAKLVVMSPEHQANVKAAQPAKSILAEDLLRDAKPAPLGEFDRDTPCLVLYTSGSTGQPKGAVHRHGHMPWTVESVARKVYQLQPDDRLFSVPRLFFAYGLGNSLSIPLGGGASTILLSERPSPALIAEVFAKYRPTIFFGVPTVFRMLLEHVRQGNKLDTSSLRFAVSAGRGAAARDLERVEGAHRHRDHRDPRHHRAAACVHPQLSRSQPARQLGRGARRLRMQADRRAGNVVEGAGRGHLHVRGGSAIPYYLNKPEKTAESIRDGWVRTGDVYRRDEEGFFWFEGPQRRSFQVLGDVGFARRSGGCGGAASGGAGGRGDRRGRRHRRHHSRRLRAAAPRKRAG